MLSGEQVPGGPAGPGEEDRGGFGSGVDRHGGQLVPPGPAEGEGLSPAAAPGQIPKPEGLAPPAEGP